MDVRIASQRQRLQSGGTRLRTDISRRLRPVAARTWGSHGFLGLGCSCWMPGLTARRGNWSGPKISPARRAAASTTVTGRVDTGQGIFGTGEIETMTSDRANVHLDGHGDVDLVVLGHGAAGRPGSAWTSGRVTTRSQFRRPPGGEMMVTASIMQPGLADPLGYWPGFWMVGLARARAAQRLGGLRRSVTA